MNDFNGASHFAAAFAKTGSAINQDYFSQLEKALEENGTKIVRAKPRPGSSPASYVAFTYQPSTGLEYGERGKTHTNTIFIQHTKFGIKRHPTNIKISSWHESIHAMQDRIPEMFATPYNEATPVVMSLEDWVWRMVLTESDVYAKTAFLGWVASKDDPYIREAMRHDGVNLNNFETCLAATDTLQDAMEMASVMWWEHIQYKQDKSDPDVTLLDHYIDFALDSYDCSRLQHGNENRPEEFVTLDRTKVAAAIGGSFGPPTFSAKAIAEKFCHMPPMSERLQEKMEHIRQKIGQPERSTLRSFDEALAARGMSGHGLAAKSRTNLSWHVVGQGKVPLHDIQPALAASCG